MNSERPVYLDCHATTPVDERVFEAMRPWFTEAFGNAASINHLYGTEAAEAVEQARGEIAQLLNTDPRNVIFTSGATEANNLTVKGLLQAAGKGSHLIISAGEHRSVLDPAKRLARSGYHVSILPIDAQGQIDPQQIADAIRENTALVSILWANNEIGTINQMSEINQICRERDVPLHSDAVQAAGKVPINLQEVPLALLSITAHKLYGPKGVGAFILQREHCAARLDPLLEGGGHERGFRSGTLPVPLIVGFGKACQLAKELMAEEQQRISQLRDALWHGLAENIEGILLNGHPDDRLAGNLNISIPDVDGDALMNRLTDIAVSSGSACTSANPEPSYVLRAIGRNDALTRASLRFGIGRFNTSQDITIAIQSVTEAVKQLQNM